MEYLLLENAKLVITLEQEEHGVIQIIIMVLTGLVQLLANLVIVHGMLIQEDT